MKLAMPMIILLTFLTDTFIKKINLYQFTLSSFSFPLIFLDF